MIARKQEISLQLNQSIDALPGAPAALLRKERIDIAHAAMRLRREESGECFILAGRAHKPPEFLRSVSRVMLTFSLIKLDKVRRAFGACEFESVEGSLRKRLRGAPHLRATKGWLSWKTLHEGQVARDTHRREKTSTLRYGRPERNEWPANINCTAT